VFAWRATGDISAEVFSMSKPAAWRSVVEMAMSSQGQPYDDDDAQCDQFGPKHISNCRSAAMSLKSRLIWLRSHNITRPSGDQSI